LPHRFRRGAAAADAAAANAGSAERFALFDCFLRRYSPGDGSDGAAVAGGGGDQLLTSFHADTATITVNVALTSDADLDGGAFPVAASALGAAKTVNSGPAATAVAASHRHAPIIHSSLSSSPTTRARRRGYERMTPWVARAAS
jgi:hypothetical protein